MKKKKVLSEEKKGKEIESVGSRGKKREMVTIMPINIGVMEVTVVGKSPLLIHRFSDKARKIIEDKQGKKAPVARGARDPEAEYRAAMYTIPGRPGKHYMRAVMFKCAFVNAASFLSGITKVILRGAVHIFGEKAHPAFVEIKGSKPKMATDPVTIGQGKTDLRYRPQYDEWSATLTIEYLQDVLTAEQVVNVLNWAGFSVGVGEKRPQQKSGDSFGLFRVAL